MQGKKSEHTDEAIIYTRFSPRKNEDSSCSCEVQRQRCEQYCEKEGYRVVSYYEDRAKSGNDADRGGLWHAVDSLEKGQVLVVYKEDRLARQVYLHEIIRRQIKKKGAWIESVADNTGGKDDNDPEKHLLRQILHAFTEYERNVLAIRTKHAMLYHQENGHKMSRHAPYGWQIDPDRPKMIIKNDYEQRVLQQMMQWHEEGHSMRRISIMLNEQGIPPRSGREWYPKVVSHILTRALSGVGECVDPA